MEKNFSVTRHTVFHVHKVKIHVSSKIEDRAIVRFIVDESEHEPLIIDNAIAISDEGTGSKSHESDQCGKAEPRR